MKRKSYLALTVLCAISIVGGKWMRADDESPSGSDSTTTKKTNPSTDVPAVTSESEFHSSVPSLILPEEDTPNSSPFHVSEPAKLLIDELEKTTPVGNLPRVRIETSTPSVIESKPTLHSRTFPQFAASELQIEENERDEQNVTLHWVGPTQIKVGKPFVYELVVRNSGTQPVTGVVVRDQVPEGVKIVSVDPKGSNEKDQIVWKFGDLESHESRRIKIRMIAQHRGSVVCQATVTSTSPAITRFRVREPKLVVKQLCQEDVTIGSSMTVTIAVSNIGDGSAEKVVVNTKFSEGLTHEKDGRFTYDLGTLDAGETRTLRVACTTKHGGLQTIRSVVTGEGNLRTITQTTTKVTEPKLEVLVEGPRLRYLDRAATYKVIVTNPGDAPANNVKLTAAIPAGFDYIGSSEGGRHDYATRTVAWFVGTLPVGSTKEVAYKAVAVKIGSQKHKVTATSQRGLQALAENVTAVEGISALLLEVVDIDDPVEVGTNTAYEIRVTNQGSLAATNIEIHAQVPKEMKILGGQGPTKYRIDGQEIVFSVLPKLAPRADAIYRVLVRGVGVGDLRFRTRLISSSLTEPVIEEESTKVYDD